MRLTPSTEMTDADRAAIAAAVEARVHGYADAAKRKDIDWFMEFWADTEGFVIAGDGTLVADYATWAETVRQAVGGTAEILDFGFFNGHTYVLARDAAVHTTEFRWAYFTTAGDTLRAHGSWSYVFRNIDGVWSVVHSAGTHILE